MITEPQPWYTLTPEDMELIKQQAEHMAVTVVIKPDWWIFRRDGIYHVEDEVEK